MTFLTALSAGLGAPLCDGVSTLLKRWVPDQSGKVKAFNLVFLLRILKNPAYVAGTLLAVAGYGLTLVALQILPLFFVQSLVAGSVIVTALGEQFFIKRNLGKHTYYAVLTILVGLVLLGVGAVPSKVAHYSQTSKLIIELGPVLLVLLGAGFVYIRASWSAVGLAALGGLLFGNASTIGRILTFPHPIWELAENPLLYALAFTGILGQYFFLVSLQRATATKSNAVMISLQTLGPAICGLAFFDDQIRSGFEVLVVLGGVLVLLGAVATALDSRRLKTQKVGQRS